MNLSTVNGKMYNTGMLLKHQIVVLYNKYNNNNNNNTIYLTVNWLSPGDSGYNACTEI